MVDILEQSMITVVQTAQARAENILPLMALLELADDRFRQGVLEALAGQGFEVGGQHPNLQLPQELVQEVGFLEEPGHCQLREALLAASQAGLLIDLSFIFSEANPGKG